MSEIGVILLMFLAGLESDLTVLKITDKTKRAFVLFVFISYDRTKHRIAVASLLAYRYASCFIYKLNDKELDKKLSEEAEVILNKGASFGQAGQAHARL